MKESFAFSYLQIPLRVISTFFFCVSSEKQNVLCTHHRQIQICTILLPLLIKPRNDPRIGQ